jgi:trigger factor
MNVSLDRQPNCAATLTIDIPADHVEKVRNEVTTAYRKQARIPGYRPGKAPLTLLRSRYQQEIDEETNERLVNSAISDTVKEGKADISSLKSVDTPVANPDGSLTIRVHAELEPEFELPDWRTITVEVPRHQVTDEEVEKHIAHLADAHATYDTITDRPLAMGDYAVANREFLLGDQSLEEALPECPPSLGNRRNAWMLMDEKTLLPGLCPAMEGMNTGEERTFDLAIPADFPEESIQGKTITCKVLLQAINTKTPPPLDDQLANLIEEGKTLEQLRQSLRERREKFLEHSFEAEKRQRVVDQLIAMVPMDLPPDFLHQETHTVMEDIVHHARESGYTDDAIREQTESIHQSAERSARTRLASRYILLRIAEKENLEVLEADMQNAVLEEAYRANLPVKKFVQELRRGNGLARLRDQVLASKALDLVLSNVTVVETAPKE